MKQFVSIFLSAVFASAILIGCGFVDSNTSRVESEEPTTIERTNIGAFATADTTGFEG
ncbi:MAG: hypothetical protein WD021_05645 [Rhodothermales bacterium]